uniref:Uncharacterized protein n=1 Tax=Plectus sambesii TaxID=2011161 RepID=A0A914XIS9_9BILA
MAQESWRWFDWRTRYLSVGWRLRRSHGCESTVDDGHLSLVGRSCKQIGKTAVRFCRRACAWHAVAVRSALSVPSSAAVSLDRCRPLALLPKQQQRSVKLALIDSLSIVRTMHAPNIAITIMSYSARR